jgi:hypothetical protein
VSEQDARDDRRQNLEIEMPVERNFAGFIHGLEGGLHGASLSPVARLRPGGDCDLPRLRLPLANISNLRASKAGSFITLIFIVFLTDRDGCLIFMGDNPHLRY